jgi:hypothetical protein
VAPSPADVARWGGSLANELVRLPVTLGRARRLLVELPEQLDRLIEALRGVEAQLDHLEHLDANLTAALGSIPGVRRALRPQ